MLGAILGDIVGSPYEFDHNNYKHKDFPLLSEKSHFTDDTVMTAAVAVFFWPVPATASRKSNNMWSRPSVMT